MSTEDTIVTPALQELKQQGQPITKAVSSIIIGSDILELISTAMYVDPRTLFREYLQNAADSIDAARASGLLQPNEGSVAIHLDRSERSIRIRDNGTGISADRFYETLTALGASAKRGTTARGFRGVGRLAGLGYAREVVFHSRFAGGDIGTLIWDCRKLRTMLRDETKNNDLRTVIAESTSILWTAAEEDTPDHFFEVELRGVARLRNDVLLNSNLVRDFVAEHCPVPFAPTFTHRETLNEYLSQHVALTDLTVHIDDEPEPVTRPHRDHLELADGRSINISCVETFELTDRDGKIGAVGWLAHHAYEGAVPTPMLLKGVRLRHGNVQIGHHAMLEELFKEDRFNVWAIGEIHIIDRRVIPNARRDHFEQNAFWLHLTNQFLPIARELSDRCRRTSIRRNWQKRFEITIQDAEARIEDLSTLGIDGIGIEPRIQASLDAIAECRKVVLSPHFPNSDPEETEIILRQMESAISNAITAARKRHDNEVGVETYLSHFSSRDRDLYRGVFEMIVEEARSPMEGHRIVETIIERLRYSS